MVVESNQVEKSNPHSSEATAVITILTKNSNQIETVEGEIEYNVHLVLVGATVLPPYLPRMVGRASMEEREAIDQEINDLKEHYTDLVNTRLDKKTGKSLLRKLQRIGRLITDYIPELQTILCDYLPTLEGEKPGRRNHIHVKNIIFLTDDIIIPWSWACYRLQGEADFEFLAQRKSCGTLIIYNEGFDLHMHPPTFEIEEEKTVNKPKNDVVIVDCDFHPWEDSSEQVGNVIDLLQNEQIQGVQTFKVEDWHTRAAKNDGNSVIGFLSDSIEDARIIHFSCDVVDNEIVLDHSQRAEPNILRRKLHVFKNGPLVTLHGCYLNHKDELNEKRLTTAFLEKGASGCLVGLLPVKGSPVGLDTGPGSIIHRFYQYIFSGKSFGQALFLAKRDFRDNEDTRYSPMWLFYELYGDPRSMLSETANRGIQESIAKALEIVWESDTNNINDQNLNEKKIKVFFSYSRKDEKMVNYWHNKMEKESCFETFIDTKNIQYGEDWQRKVDAQLQYSHVILFFFSKKSTGSEGYLFTEFQKVRKVMDRLPSTEILSIPCLLDGQAELPNSLKHLHRLELFRDSEANWNKLIIDLRNRFLN